MHRSVTLALAALFAAACDAPPSAPESSATSPSFAKEGTPDHQNTRAPFSRTVMNPCPPVPEPVAVEGYGHYNAHFKFFEGGNNARLKGHSHASGVGAISGQKYQFHEMATLLGHYTYVDSRWETMQTTRFHVISQTGLDNFFSTMKMRIIYTPQGSSAEVISLETDCRG
jgi:hypothetical protein